MKRYQFYYRQYLITKICFQFHGFITGTVVKVLRYCEVLQRGGAQMYRCTITAQRVTRTGTYGSVKHHNEEIGLHLFLYDIYNTAIDRRCARSQANTLIVKKLAPLTTRSSSLRCVSTAEHHTAEHYYKTSMTKLRKHLPRSNLSWNACQDFLKNPSQPLRSCFGNLAKMHFISHLGIKCRSKYNKVTRLLQ